MQGIDTDVTIVEFSDDAWRYKLRVSCYINLNQHAFIFDEVDSREK